MALSCNLPVCPYGPTFGYTASTEAMGHNQTSIHVRRAPAAAKQSLPHKFGLEPFPFRWNRNGAPDFCFDAFSLREPVSTSLENALSGNCLDNLVVRASASRAARFESGHSTQRGILVVGPFQRTEHDEHIEITEFRY